jgi:catechol 2,3-dioxygenase-like lactoylglutathione lyase family enzyme
MSVIRGKPQRTFSILKLYTTRSEKMKELIEVAFFTDNVDAMSQFYAALLGSPPTAQSPNMAIFMSGRTKIFIHKTYKPEEGELPPENHFAYAVEVVDDEVKKLTEKGLVMEFSPKEYYWGRSAYLRDPDGNLIELHNPEEPS